MECTRCGDVERTSDRGDVKERHPGCFVGYFFEVQGISRLPRVWRAGDF